MTERIKQVSTLDDLRIEFERIADAVTQDRQDVAIVVNVPMGLALHVVAQLGHWGCCAVICPVCFMTKHEGRHEDVATHIVSGLVAALDVMRRVGESYAGCDKNG